MRLILYLRKKYAMFIFNKNCSNRICIFSIRVLIISLINVIILVLLMLVQVKTVQAASIVKSDNLSINNVLGTQTNLLQAQTPLNNNSNKLLTKSAVPKTENDFNWPDTGDFVLEANPAGGKIAYVRNSKQFMHAVYGYGVNYERANTNRSVKDSDITKIVLVKDIDIVSLRSDKTIPDIQVKNPTNGRMSRLNLPGGSIYNNHNGGDGDSLYMTIRRPSFENKLTIDGQGHYINAGNFYIETSDSLNVSIEVNNVTLYGSTYLGFIRAENNSGWTHEIFRDVNYYGAQFLYSNGDVNITTYGTVNAFSLYTYNGPDGNLYRCQGTATNAREGQQNMEVHNVTFGADSVYNGYTYAGTALYLTGNAKLEKNANVNLYPNTGNGYRNGKSIVMEAEDWKDWGYKKATGLYLSDDNSKIEMGKDSILNISTDARDPSEGQKSLADYIPAADKGLIDTSDDMMTKGFTFSDTTHANIAVAIKMLGSNSKIVYDHDSNAQINLNSDGKRKNSIINIVGGLADINDGSMKILASNLGDSNINLLEIGSNSNILVDKNGVFDMSAPNATGKVNMISSAGNFKVMVYKPKRLKIVRPNDDSNLVSGNGNIEMHDIKATASGNGVVLQDVPFQYLNLPFIRTNLTTEANDAFLQAQTTSNELKKLQTVLQQLQIGNSNNFNEFGQIDVTSINGPELSDTFKTIEPQQKGITGTISNKEPNDTSPLTDTQIRVVLQHQGQEIDLGTTTEINPDKDSVDPKKTMLNPPVQLTPIEPDKVDWFESSVNNLPNRSKPGADLATPWKYVTDPHVISWQGNTFNINDINLLIDNYNRNNPKNKITNFAPSDILKVMAVNNFQASTVRQIRLSNLSLNLDKTKGKKVYALGDDLQIPLQYQDVNPDAKKLSIYGYMDPANNEMLVPPVSQAFNEFSMTPNKDVNQLVWKIPASEGVTATPQKHNYKFYGQDDKQSQSPIFDTDSSGKIPENSLLNYFYDVINVPAYAGNKLLDKGHTKIASNENGYKNPAVIASGKYTEANIFTAKNKTAKVDNFTLSRDNKTASAADSPGIRLTNDLRLTVSAGNKQQTQSIKYDTNYQASDFDQIAVNGYFPVNTTFKVEQGIEIDYGQKDLNLAPVQLQTNFDNDGILDSLDLGTTRNLQLGNVYLLRLTVPNLMDFGKHILNNKGKAPYFISNRDEVQQNLQLEYTQIPNNKLAVSVKLQNELENNQGHILYNSLFYKASGSNSTEQNLNTTNDTVIFNKVLPANVSNTNVNNHLADSWWVNKQQVAGIFLKNGLNNPQLGHYSTTLNWSVTNSI